MAILTQDNLTQIGKTVDDSIKRLMPSMLANVQTDIRQIKQVQTDQASTIKSIKADISNLKGLTRKQGVLLEDLDERFKADSELLRDNLNVKDQVDDHETRLSGVEADQTLLKRVVKEHSQQLKTKPA